MTTPNISEGIEKILFFLSIKWLDELKSCKTPMSYRDQMRFTSLVPAASAGDIYKMNASAYLYGYASVMDEFKAILHAAEKVPFVAKKGKP